ncbi:MAG: EamA family transporter [Thermoplasmata archaeon]
MVPNWLIFSLITVVLLGCSGVISKYALKGIQSDALISGSFLVIVPMSGVLFISYFLIRGLDDIDNAFLIIGVLSSILANLGFFLYFDALEKGPLAIIGSLTSAYPGLIVIIAILFLGETISYLQGSGIAMIMVGIICLFYFHGDGGVRTHYPKMALLLGILAFLCWSAWGVLLKIALREIDFVFYIGLSCFVMPPLTLAYLRIRTGRMSLSIPWKSTAPFALAIISIEIEQLGFFSETYSVSLGQASLVFPIVASFPIITVILAFGLLKERLSKIEWLMVFMVIIGLILVSSV